MSACFDFLFIGFVICTVKYILTVLIRNKCVARVKVNIVCLISSNIVTLNLSIGIESKSITLNSRNYIRECKVIRILITIFKLVRGNVFSLKNCIFTGCHCSNCIGSHLDFSSQTIILLIYLKQNLVHLLLDIRLHVLLSTANFQKDFGTSLRDSGKSLIRSIFDLTYLLQDLSTHLITLISLAIGAITYKLTELSSIRAIEEIVITSLVSLVKGLIYRTGKYVTSCIRICYHLNLYVRKIGSFRITCCKLNVGCQIMKSKQRTVGYFVRSNKYIVLKYKVILILKDLHPVIVVICDAISLTATKSYILTSSCFTFINQRLTVETVDRTNLKQRIIDISFIYIIGFIFTLFNFVKDSILSEVENFFIHIPLRELIIESKIGTLMDIKRRLCNILSVFLFVISGQFFRGFEPIYTIIGIIMERFTIRVDSLDISTILILNVNKLRAYIVSSKKNSLIILVVIRIIVDLIFFVIEVFSSRRFNIGRLATRYRNLCVSCEHNCAIYFVHIRTIEAIVVLKKRII